MKRKILIAMLSAVAVCSAAFAAGCAVGQETYQQYLNRNNATARVTYNANGGMFETKQEVKDMYYSANSPVLNIGTDVMGADKIDESTSARVKMERAGYVFAGWFTPARDAEGNILYEDDAKTVVKLGEELQFPYRIQDKEQLVLYAKWVLDAMVEFRLVSETPVTVQTTVKDENGEDKIEEKTVNDGEVLATRSFGTDTEIYIDDKSPVTVVGSTFLSFYEDEKCTLPFFGEVSKPVGEEIENHVLYAKYIEGDWEVVKTKSQVTAMFANPGRKNFYIFNDIDCQNDTFAIISATNCKIEGNGYRLYNMKFSRTASNGDSFAIFGRLSPSASIKDLTLENISVNYTVRGGSVQLYLVSKETEEGATLENFNIKNVNMEVSSATEALLLNLWIAENGNIVGYFSDNWLFGSGTGAYKEGYDAQYLATYTGVTVEDYSLTVNENKIV